MATYKKKSFRKKYKEAEIDELVDIDGGGLIGDKTKTFNSNSEISTDTPFNGEEEADQDIPQTSTDFRKAAGGAKSNMYYTGSNYSRGKRAALPESVKILAKERMEGLIEDLMNDRSNPQDIVKGRNNQDINRNDIPDIDDITQNNQALSSKIKSVVDIINSQDINGDGAGIILNYIISNIKSSEIPDDYKRVIKSKL